MYIADNFLTSILANWKTKTIDEILICVKEYKLTDIFYSEEFIELTIEHDLYHIFKYLITESLTTEFKTKQQSRDSNNIYYSVIYDLVSSVNKLPENLDINSKKIQKLMTKYKSKLASEFITRIFFNTICHNKNRFVKLILNDKRFNYKGEISDYAIRQIVLDKNKKLILTLLATNKISKIVKTNIFLNSLEYSNFGVKIINDNKIFNSDNINLKYFKNFVKKSTNNSNPDVFKALYNYNKVNNLIDNKSILNTILTSDNLDLFKIYFLHNDFNLDDAIKSSCKNRAHNIFSFLINNYELSDKMLDYIMSIHDANIIKVILNSKLPDDNKMYNFIIKIFKCYGRTNKVSFLSTTRQINIESIIKYCHDFTNNDIEAIFTNQTYDLTDYILDNIINFNKLDSSNIKIIFKKHTNVKFKNEQLLCLTNSAIEYIINNDLVENMANSIEYLLDRNVILDQIIFKYILQKPDFEFTDSLITILNKFVISYRNSSSIGLNNISIDLSKRIRLYKMQVVL